METTIDAFLDGQIEAEQPKSGYRAATDPVFMAAAVNAKPGQTVLDVGCGVGVASLCLQKRVQNINITGLEIQPSYAKLARENGLRNKMNLRILEGDLRSVPTSIRELSFDIVMTNPPYFARSAATLATDNGKATANSTDITMARWVELCLKRIKPKGWIYVIQMADQLPEILSGLHGRAGDIRVLPMASRPGKPAKRVIVAAKKGAKGAMTLLCPFVVHSGDAHQEGKSDYSKFATDILRNGAKLPL